MYKGIMLKNKCGLMLIENEQKKFATKCVFLTAYGIEMSL